ncbi:MAG: PD-(D/E)XK nuclease family protein [Oscillospiraceae bacterium]|nr:PD-(D/E)XK nuclease family protein [Oscillospiraceae bacterium]
MKEKTILAPGLNGNELMRSLALHGINCIGMRICGAAELARLALMRSGISISEDFVSAKEEAAIAADALGGEPYFGKTSYSDIQEIAVAIRRMRSLSADEDEEQGIRDKLPAGIFKEKNEALLHVYQRYIALLKSRKAVDAAALIRKAAMESKPVNADFMTLKEYPLNPLEKKLLGRVSGGTVTEISLQELFERESQALQLAAVRNCYGAPNEVETILTDIYSGKRLDQCTVAVADALTYGQLFFDYALLYDIPVTFGCGIPVMNSNPARLLAVYHRWITGGFFGAAAIGELLSSKAFDRSKLYELFPEKDENFRWGTFYKVLGDLRLTNDPAVNEQRIADFRKAIEEEAALPGKENSKEYKTILRKQSCIPCLEIMGKELGLPAEEFISRYAYIRRGSDTNAERLLMMLDISAARAIYEELKVIRSSGLDRSADDIIPNVLKITVCSQRSEAGKLHVTGIEGAFGSLRQHLYLAGMSASNYPGSPKENYLLLDADLELFGPDAESCTADGRVLRKREQLLSLAKLASTLGTDISVSYAGLNVSELKKDNASSLIFELFREAYGRDASIKELEEHTSRVDYFEPAISCSRKIGEAYTRGSIVCPDTKEEGEESAAVSWNLDKAWSPTALDTFFGCPRRFMLGYILGIPEPEDYDPFVVMNAMDTGTLAHSLMEELGGTDMDREEFLSLSEEYFDRFIREHPPLIAENVLPVKAQFLDMMETAYDMDPHREIALEEEDISCTHESGVRIHGFPDRVEKLEDGSYLVVDFKSGRTVSHVQDDIGTCLQVIIYAYLTEQKGFRVSGGEYRYIRLGETVTCRYDDDMKRQLLERLTLFKNSLRSGDFPVAEITEGGDDPCHFCKYKAICGKTKEGTVS